MTATDMTDAVALLRRAGLAPTRRRLAVAALVFSGATVPQSVEELRERAIDAGICLSPEAAEESLAELRAVGLLPQFLTARVEPRADVKRAARLLQAMGNPHRLLVLRELLDGEKCVGELLRTAGIQQSALSQHLARLRSDGLVTARRAARNIFYSLAGGDVPMVLRSLGQ
ncbi:MAG TPA: metalloregulator ArsR/SmtB family transcription factor [Candidatus Omnitrophota bacterium]|nr:metalloregulator ArsR/SmtB family transcription factor [Candidatus Omnitrophota bacterium]